MGIIATDAGSTVSPRRLLAAPLFGRRRAGSPSHFDLGGRRSHVACYLVAASHGFTASTPVSTKSSTLWVASPALQLRQIAAICASPILIGRPARSREATISA